MRLVLFIFLTLSSINSFGQIRLINRSLTDSSIGYLYIGVDNYLKVVGNDQDLTLKIGTGFGDLTKIKKNEYISRNHAITDSCLLEVYKGRNKIHSRYFKVRSIPVPVAVIGNISNTDATIQRLLISGGLNVSLPNCFFNRNLEIFSFKAIFLQNGDSIITNNEWNRFSKEQIRLLKISTPGDKILFENIRVRGGDTRSFQLAPIWIRII